MVSYIGNKVTINLGIVDLPNGFYPEGDRMSVAQERVGLRRLVEELEDERILGQRDRVLCRDLNRRLAPSGGAVANPFTFVWNKTLSFN